MVLILPLQLPLPAVLIFAGIDLFLLGAGLREAVPFLVDDGTGAVLVDPKGGTSGWRRPGSRGTTPTRPTGTTSCSTRARSPAGSSTTRSTTKRDSTMARRSFRAAAVSIVLGVVVLGALAFLWTTL